MDSGRGSACALERTGGIDIVARSKLMAKMVMMAVPRAGAKFERIERDIPQPGPKELLIKEQACGVCHSDSATVEGLLPGIVYPRVPGHEVIGTVEAVGDAVDG